jgi:uncharacterized membrane protein YeaQ/YmgE (transglycosylase-associated protein family)
MFLEISLINLTLWFFVGMAMAYLVHRDNMRGFTVTSVFSILGAEIGGYLSSFLLGKAMHGFSLEGLVFAGLGAMVLAIFYRFSFSSEKRYA